MTVKLLVIVGPTAVGKTRLGVEVAHALGSEILSADSRQVYRGLDLGTGKDLDEYSAVDPPVPHHLIDIADPREVYTLFRYQKDCYEVLRRLAEKPAVGSGSVPILMVGGSGLYVEAVIKAYNIADVPENPELRKRLDRLPTDVLVGQLQDADAGLAERTDLASRRRVIRALEIAAAADTGPVKTSDDPGVEIDCRVYALDLDREVVRQRVRSRLENRFGNGMVDEVRGLMAAGLSLQRLEHLGLEYREIAAYLAGRKDRRQMVDDLAVAIGQFAKRQRTWFRGMERRGVPITWIEPGNAKRILDDVERWVGEASGR